MRCMHKFAQCRTWQHGMDFSSSTWWGQVKLVTAAEHVSAAAACRVFFGIYSSDILCMHCTKNYKRSVFAKGVMSSTGNKQIQANVAPPVCDKHTLFHHCICPWQGPHTHKKMQQLQFPHRPHTLADHRCLPCCLDNHQQSLQPSWNLPGTGLQLLAWHHIHPRLSPRVLPCPQNLCQSSTAHLDCCCLRVLCKFKNSTLLHTVRPFRLMSDIEDTSSNSRTLGLHGCKLQATKSASTCEVNERKVHCIVCLQDLFLKLSQLYDLFFLGFRV